ncbi:MAG: lamin tail domain-containing protein, partial [Ignavibacteria bacterium]|nr:lamin tail domain-containing protein [Ignavibacteria bacterium]
MKNIVLIVLWMFFFCVGVVSAQIVKMNEVYARGTNADPDWIEIYNSGSISIDISGYKIYDTGGESGTKAKKEIASGSIVPAKGFLVIVTDGSAESDFGLSNNGEKVWLEDKAGVLVDSVTFSAMTATQAYARIPDGGVWKLNNAITRGATNGTGSSVEFKDEIITDYKLQQNYPNPFNPSTKIEYSIQHSGLVTLKIYDVLGNIASTVVNQYQNAGSYIADFNAERLSSG